MPYLVRILNYCLLYQNRPKLQKKIKSRRKAEKKKRKHNIFVWLASKFRCGICFVQKVLQDLQAEQLEKLPDLLSCEQVQNYIGDCARLAWEMCVQVRY